MSCYFQQLVGSPCGSNPRSPSESVVILSSCKKDISAHLRSIKIKPGSIANEVELILARVGTFSLPDNFSELTICPKHRDQLGIGWRKTSVKCSVPQDLSSHGSVRRKNPTGQRSVGKELSNRIKERTNILLPIGSGKYFKVFTSKKITTIMLIKSDFI